MKQIVTWVEGFAIAIGGPGLFLIAFLDSSILSFPEVNDILIVVMVTRHPERMLYYASMSTMGSIAGCLLLYGIGLKGGEAFLRKRFHERHVDRGLDVYRRYGLLTVVIPAILPPPAPFKIFVLLAGVARMKLPHFVLAIAIGRGVRYFGEGWLALRYGEHAIDYIHENGTTMSLGLAGIVLAGAVAFLVVRWTRRRQARREARGKSN